MHTIFDKITFKSRYFHISFLCIPGAQPSENVEDRVLGPRVTLLILVIIGGEYTEWVRNSCTRAERDHKMKLNLMEMKTELYQKS